MPTTIELIAKATNGGSPQTFKYGAGAKHAAVGKTQYSLVVDGSTKMPVGTKVVRNGKNLEVQFPDGSKFEITDLADVSESSFINPENAQVLDAAKGAYVPATEIQSGAGMPIVSAGEAVGAMGEIGAVGAAAAAAAGPGLGAILGGVGALALVGAAAGGGGGGGGGDGGSSPSATALGVIKNFAKSNGGTAPTAADYTSAGVTGVTAANLDAINSALATAALDDTKVDSPAKVQTIVDSYNAIIAEANGAAADGSATDPAAAQYAAIGANIGGAATNAQTLGLLNDVVGEKTAGDISPVAKIDTLGSIVDRIVQTAAGGTPNPALTTEELTAIGITGVTPQNLPAVLAAIAATPDDGSGVSNLGALQSVAAAGQATGALNTINAFAEDNGASNPAPSVTDYTTAGVIGVTSDNLAPINNALASPGIVGTNVDTPAEVQALVDAYNAILAEANGASADPTSADPTAAQYGAIGVVLGNAATDAENLALLNDVVGGKDASAIDNPAEISALAAIVNNVMSVASGGEAIPPLTAADLTALGITTATPENLPAILAAIAATPDDGSGITNLTDLQAIAASAIASLNTISAFAEDNGATNPAPTLADFSNVGVTGVNAGNIDVINSALASPGLTGLNADSPAEIQALVDGYSKILAEANGGAPDATPTDPTATDYAAIGANIGAAATDPENLALLNDVIGNKLVADVDTPAEISALAAIVNGVMTTAAGGVANPPLSPADLAAIGITGVTPDNLPAILAAIAATPDDGSGLTNIGDLQTVVTTAAAAAVTALATISGFAEDNGAVNPAPSLADFSNAGVTGVDATNLAAINSALASGAIVGSGTDTTTEVQALVNAFNKILAEANGAAPDATPADPTPTDYAAIGANIGTAATDPEALSLLNDVIGGQTPSNIDSVAEINALAATVDKVMNVAAGGAPAPTLAELLAIDVPGVTPDNLAAVLAAIAATPDDGSGVDSLAELQAVTASAVAGALAALNTISSYAEDNGTVNPAPTLTDYSAAGVTGVTAGNLAAVNSILASAPVAGANADTTAEVQTIVDAYAAILNAADNTDDDDVALNQAQFNALGLAVIDTPSEVALLNDIIDNATSGEVDTQAKLAELARIADALATTAAGGTPSPALTAADLALLGMTGVTAANLPAVLAAIAAGPDDGTGADSLSELQAVSAAAAAAAAKIAAYADDSLVNPVPLVADYASIGVTGVDASNVAAINSVVDNLVGTSVDTPAEVQTIVNAYNKILGEANGAAADATPADPTAGDYAAIGANIGAAATDVENIALLNDVIGGKTTTDVDTPAEVSALAAIVNGVMTTAAGGAASPALTAADLAAIGITGVTAANLPAILAAIAATADDGTGVDSLSDLQTLADAAAGAADKIVAYADSNANPVPVVTDYSAIGVTGVEASNIDAINSAVDALTGTAVDTPAEVQAIVDAFTKILAEANGATADATPADPTAADYAAIGADIGAAGTDVEALALLNDVMGEKATTDVDSPAEINALAAIVNGVMTTAAGGTASPALTAADLAAIGIAGVTADNLPAILAAIAATTDDGTGADSLTEIQALANAAIAANDVIVGYANDNSNPSPLVTDFAAIGVIGVNASNLSAINSAVDALTGTAVDTLAEVQAVVDAFNTILAEANGATADATPADPTTGDYAAIGASIGSAATDAEALSLLNGVIGEQSTTGVDTVAEINAIAAIVDKVMNAASGGSPTPSETELATLGITGVTAANLPAILAALAATADDGTAADSLGEIQAIADAASAAIAKITAYADSNANPAPLTTDYAAIGVTGVSVGNVGAVNSAVDTFVGTGVDTPAEVQSIVSAYTKILLEANSAAPDATPGMNPLASDYAAIGASIGLAATDAENLALLNDVIAVNPPFAVDTVTEINEIARIIDAVQLTASGGTPVPALTADDFDFIQVFDVTPENLSSVLAAIAAAPDTGLSTDSRPELQLLVNQVTAAYSTITTFAQNDGGAAPTTTDFANIAVTGVTLGNIDAINSALASTPVNGLAVDSQAEVQAIVDSYSAILAGADNTNDNDVTLTQSQFNGLGLTSIDDPEEVTLFNDVIDNAVISEVDTQPELANLTRIVDAIMLQAAGGTPSPALTGADLQAIGMSWPGAPVLTAPQLTTILAGITLTTDDGTGVDTLVELQGVLNTAVDFTPAVNSIAITSNAGADNTYKAGDIVSITVQMTEAVIVVSVLGTPRVAINVGGTSRFASYVSGSLTSDLIFNYTIAADTDSNGISIAANSLQLNGGTIRDLTLNNAVLTHSALSDNASHLVDTTAPTQTSVVTSITDDVWTPTVISSGGSTADTSPIVAGTISAGLSATEQVSILRDGVKIGTATMTGATTWTFTDSSVALGAHNYRARVDDLAGNLGAQSAAYNFTKAAPSLTAPDLVASSDTGSSNTDNVTTDSTPTLTGTVSGAITHVTVWDDADSDGVVDAGELVFGSKVAVTAGTWTLTPSNTVVDGVYHVRAAGTDAGGTPTGAVSPTIGSSPDFLTVSHTDLRSAKTFTGAATADYFGRDMASIGDFNGDGYEDFAVMASGADATARGDAGKTYVFYGSANGIDNTVSLGSPGGANASKFLEISGAATSDGGNYDLAAMVSRVGDVNGDGIDDLIISQQVGNAPNGGDGGAVYVVYGSNTAYSSGQFDLNTIAGGTNTNGFRIANDSTVSGARFGIGAGGGDVNSDGYADLILGASYFDPLGRGDHGATFVVYGGAAQSNLALTESNANANGFGIWGGNNTNFASKTSKADDQRVGENATAVGDVNGDGIIDFVVTSPYSSNYLASPAGTDAGSAYLIYGKQGGMPNLDLNDLTTAEGIRLNSQQFEWLGGGNDFSGNFVTGLGDINGDGVGDWAVSAPFSHPGDPGHVWVLYGKAGGYTADINLDAQVYYGLPNGITASGEFNSETGFLIVNEDFKKGSTTNEHTGSYEDWLGVSISSAGDVNLDGVDDILVGARYADAIGVNDDKGATYVVYGKLGGMGSNLVELADVVANPNLGYVTRGINISDQYGVGVTSGDWNGDGIVDYAGGRALGDTTPFVDNGIVYMLDGNTGKATNNYTAGDDSIVGTAAADRILGGTGNDTVTVLSTGDVAMGGQGNDSFAITSNDFARIDGGLGSDTIVVGGAGLELDLPSVGAKLQHIETIDLGGSTNSVSLRLSDALNLTDNPTQTLTVKGTSGSVNLIDADGGTWADSGDINISGTNYDIYHHSALASTNTQGDVLVQQGLTVNSNADTGPRGTTHIVNVNGDYQLRMSDFGFTDLEGDSMSAVRINSGGNLFLNGAPVSGVTTVTAAQIIAGKLEWHAPNINTGTTLEPINFNVIDNSGTGTMSSSPSTLTLSRTVAATSTLDAGGTRFDGVANTGIIWQAAYDQAILKGGHLATFEGDVGNATAQAEATSGIAAGYLAWIGLEQSSTGTEPGTGWHWNTGSTIFTWGSASPDNGGGTEDNGTLWSPITGTKVNDYTSTATGANGYIVEYENAKFIRTGEATQVDIMQGSAQADVIVGLGGADVLAGMAGDDRFMAPDTAFGSINGGSDFDVIEYTAAVNISGATLDSKVTDVEGVHLGTGNQTLVLTQADVNGMSSTTNTLYVLSSGAGDKVTLTDGFQSNDIGSGANQWHNLGTANGLTTYKYFDGSNNATDTQVLVDSTINVSTNAAPTGNTATVNVAGDYTLRLSDFGFVNLDGGEMSAVRINLGGNLFLNGVAVSGVTTVSAADIISGKLEWQAPNFNVGTTTEAINFNVIDNFGAGTLSDAANTLTLSRNVAATSTLDGGGTRFDAISTGLQNWQAAYDQAIAAGAHLATFEGNAGNGTAIADANAQYGLGGWNAWIGLEQSSTGAEPGSGWHWNTGDTAFTFASTGGNPDNAAGIEDVGSLFNLYTGTKINDANAASTLGGHVVEYENAQFIRTGEATQVDIIQGSAQADIMAGLGGADQLSGMAGDDRFLVPDTAFASINGGSGIDVIEYTGAATILGATLDAKVTDVEGIELGTGNQSLLMSVADVRGMSSTTETLYVTSGAGSDQLILSDGVGTGANQWHNVGTANGVTTYRYFDSANGPTSTQLLVDTDITVSTNAVPIGTTATTNVAGDYKLRMSDFGFADANGDSMSAARINSGGNLFLDGAPVSGVTTVTAADIIAGRLEWHAPNLNTGTTTEAINFNVIDNVGAGAVSVAANTLTLSRTIAAGASAIDGASRFDVVSVAGNWQAASDAAAANGGHLATFESGAGRTTALAEGGNAGWIGLEQSSSGTEPGGGWHWTSGNTNVLNWGAGEPNNFAGVEDFGVLYAVGLNDGNGGGSLGIYNIEYENAMFIRTGEASQIDIMQGSAQADIMAGLGGADQLSGMAGDDRFLVPDMAFTSINGGTGFDVVEYTAAARISGAALDAKVTDVEGIHLGTGDQTLTMTLADVQGMSSTSDSLYISSSGSGDKLVLISGTGASSVGNGSSQWHDLGAANGVTTYRYFDGTNTATATQLLVDSTVVVSDNAAPTGTTSTVTIAGDYQLRLSDFGFADIDGSSMSAVRINSGSNLFLSGVAVIGVTTVTVSDIIAGKLEWHAPNLNTGTTLEAINFNVIDNFGGGTLSSAANVLTLSRTVAATSTLDGGGTRFDAVSTVGQNWQAAYDQAIASGAHLATFESNAGNSTAITEGNAQFGGAGAAWHAWIGLEQSSSGAEPGAGWHWSTGNTSITFGTGQPDNSGGAEDAGSLYNVVVAGSKVNDMNGTFGLGGHIVEYENAMFIRTGDANQVDIMTGSAQSDIFSGLGSGDVLSGMAGDDRFIVPDSLFNSINGGAGFDVIEYNAASVIFGSSLDAKVTDVEAIHLGAGKQSVNIALADVLGMSSTTDTLYISSSGSSDTVDIAEVIGAGANQWHNQGTVNGVVTYQYYDAGNSATLAKLIIDSTVVVS